VGKPYVESFNGRVRDELLNLEEFTSLTVAQVVVEAWRIEYNTYRPHSALDGLTPPSTQRPGPALPIPHSHSEWTTNRGPVTCIRPFWCEARRPRLGAELGRVSDLWVILLFNPSRAPRLRLHGAQ
jgi:hypothetical protein